MCRIESRFITVVDLASAPFPRLSPPPKRKGNPDRETPNDDEIALALAPDLLDLRSRHGTPGAVRAIGVERAGGLLASRHVEE
jgi:hypothetical protein